MFCYILEFEATSCQDYKDILFATLDGFYNIYPTGKETKQRVFCKGLSEAGPAESLPYGLLGRLNGIQLDISCETGLFEQ